MVHVVRATAQTLAQVADNMRQEDIREIEVATGKTPHESLQDSLSFPGEVWVAYLDGSRSPFAAFGCSRGVVWLLCTDEVQNAKLSVFKEARKVINRWLNEYGLLQNFAFVENTLHLSWIKALGFTFGTRVEHRGHLFQHFVMEKGHV